MRLKNKKTGNNLKKYRLKIFQGYHLKTCKYAVVSANEIFRSNHKKIFCIKNKKKMERDNCLKNQAFL